MTDAGLMEKHLQNKQALPTKTNSLGTRWNPLSVYVRLWKLPGKREARQLRRLHARGSVVCVPWSSSTPGLISAPSTLWPRHRLGARLTSTSTVTCHVQLVSFTPGLVIIFLIKLPCVFQWHKELFLFLTLWELVGFVIFPAFCVICYL